MKIPSTIKYESLSTDFKKKLELIDVTNAKWTIWTLLIILYDLSIVISIASMSRMEYIWVLYPFIIVLHIWGVRLSFKNAYSTQLETVLFFGVMSLFGSITTLVLMFGLSFHAL